MRRELAVAGPADPEVVWERYVRIESWPTWAPFISATAASGTELVPGLTGTVHGPLGARVEFVVDAVDSEQRTWRWSVRSGPAALRLGHEVLARAAGGTVATLTLDGLAPVVLGYLPAASLALHRLTR